MEMEQSFLMVLFPDTDPVKIANTLKKSYEEGSGDPLVEAGETIWQIFYDKKVKRTRTLDNMVREICTKGFTPQTAKLALMVSEYNFDEAVLWLRENGELHALSRLIYDETSEWRSKRSLYIKNIAPTMSKQDLREKFEEWGKLVRCTLPVDPETGQSKSYAFVEYRKAVDAVRAMKNLHNCDMYGRKIRISFSKSYPRSARFRQKGVKPPERPGKIRRGTESDVESIATSAQSVGWAHHFRQRRLHQRLTNVKDIPNDRDVQIAKKYGNWTEAWNGRWQVEHEGYVYIFAKDRSTVITMWPEDIDKADTNNKQWSLLKNLKKLRQENGILRDNLKSARNLAEQEKNHVSIMGFKLPRVAPKDSSKLRKVLQDLSKLTNKLRVLEHEATAPSWAKPQKPKTVKKLRKSQQAKIPIEEANWFKLKSPKKKKDVKQRRNKERNHSTPSVHSTSSLIAAKVDNLEELILSLKSEIKRKPKKKSSGRDSKKKSKKESYIDPYIQTTPIAEAYAFAMRKPSPSPEAPARLPCIKEPIFENSVTPSPSITEDDNTNHCKLKANKPKTEREVTPDVEMFVANSESRRESRQKPPSPVSNMSLISEAQKSWENYSGPYLANSSPRTTLSHSTESSNPNVFSPVSPSPSPPKPMEDKKKPPDKLNPHTSNNERIRRYPSYSWDADKANLMSGAPSCVKRMQKIREEYQASGKQEGSAGKVWKDVQTREPEYEGESKQQENTLCRLQVQSTRRAAFSIPPPSNNALITIEERLPPDSLFAKASFSITSTKKDLTNTASPQLQNQCDRPNQLKQKKRATLNPSAPVFVSKIERPLASSWNEVKPSPWISSEQLLVMGGDDLASEQNIEPPGAGSKKIDISKDWTSGSWGFSGSIRTSMSATQTQFFPQSTQQPQQASTQPTVYSGWGSTEANVNWHGNSSSIQPGSNQSDEVKSTPTPPPKKEIPKRKTKGLIMGPHDPTNFVPNMTQDMCLRGKKGKSSSGSSSKRGRGGFGSRGGKKWNSGSRGRGPTKRNP